MAATCTPRARLLLRCDADPLSGNLDRVQIIKGWLDAMRCRRKSMTSRSGDRKTRCERKLPSVGNTVDVENATWTNTIGATELITV
jgi:hypothetical protein